MKYIDTVLQARDVIRSNKPVEIKSTNGVIRVPCMTTYLVVPELVMANTYNPNAVPSDKMELLRESIQDNGFCFPIVTIWDEDLERFIVIDGFHRSVIGGEEWIGMEYLPIVILDHNVSKRMVATHQFNKARGVHQVDLDAEIIRALIEQGMSEKDIAVKLGMEEDTIHRYKQITGVAELFKNTNYSMSWEMEDIAE